MKKLLFIFLQYLLLSTYAQNIDEALIRKHVYYLSSDKLQGRSPGEKGERLAAKYIIKNFKSYGLEPKGSKGFEQPFGFSENTNPHDTAEGKIKREGKNIIGYLDNHAANTIIIGAHYDHLGKGNHGNSLDANPIDKIHNGADDNASGVAGVLELARYYVSNNITEKCNFIFICFSAEESGLIGSKYFTNNPAISLDKVQFMLNMDMIGRLNDSLKLLVYGVGTSPVFVPLLKGMDHMPLVIKSDSSGIGPSDYTSFYLKNIPVLAFFTGSHGDYHRPSDDADKINYRGEVLVLNYIKSIVDTLAQLPKIPFLPTRNESSNSVSFKVTLGIMPDYSYDGAGLRADAVSEGKPAFKAGLKAGDVIIKLGDYDVKNIQDYMKGLAKFKKGETTVVKVKRGNEEMSFTVTF